MTLIQNMHGGLVTLRSWVREVNGLGQRQTYVLVYAIIYQIILNVKSFYGVIIYKLTHIF